MNKNNNLLEKFNKIKLFNDKELDKLDFFELGLYLEFLNNLEKKHKKLEETTED